MRLRRAIDNAVGSRAFVLRFLRGKVRGGRFGFPHSVGCFIHNELPLATDCRLRTYPDRK